MLNKVLLSAAMLLGLGQSGCLTSYEDPTPSSVQENTHVTSQPPEVKPVLPSDSTSLWMQYGDPALIAARVAEEGPLEVSSQRHGCSKYKFATLGQTLMDLGVNMASAVPLEVTMGTTDPQTFCNTFIPPGSLSTDQAQERATKSSQSARYLYCSGRLTLGLPPYAARLAESTVLTTAQITKLFDTLAAASTEIVNSNLASATRCADSTGTKAVLFNADNSCNTRGMACLQGYTPSAEQLNVCNRLVNSGEATTAQTINFTTGGSITIPAVDAITAGKRLAAASILANAYLCE